MAGTVIIHGLDQIQRDLAKAAPNTSAALRAGLSESAEPVGKIAEALSLREIRRMPRSPQWAETRAKVTRHAVFIVPKERGVRGRGPRARPFGPTKTGGPTIGELILGRSFEPALAAGAPIVESRVSILLNGVFRT